MISESFRKMVSIIIPNYNGEKHIEICLASLQKQSLKEFEVIVVDNGSIDQSINIVRRQFPEAHLVKLEENFGFARAANQGIKMAQGEYIALLNNDTEANSYWLEELVKGMKRSKEIGMCASKIIQFFNRSRLDTAGDGYTKFGISIKRGHNQPEDEYPIEEFVFGACAAAALYRRSIFDETGYFDEDFFCIYEDVDLSFRTQLAGYKCLYVPTAIVYHRIGGTSGQDNDFTIYYGQKNMEHVFLKNMPFPLLLKYLPLHVVYLILAFAYHLLKKNGGTFLRSKGDVLKQIGLILQKRKTIQSKKKVSLSYLESIFYKRSLFKHLLKMV